MLGLNANVSHYFFECSALPPEVFQVANFNGVEEISRLFRFEIELVSQDPFVNFAQVINQPATFIMMRGLTPVVVQGVVVDFLQAGRTSDFVAYRAVLAPRLWRLSLSHQSRIFQHLTVERIITTVLEEAGFGPADFRFELSASYPERDYVVQFEETDLNFICRLMEHEGIFFFFEHTDQGDVVVITDDPSVPVPIDGISTLEYREGAGLLPDTVEAVQNFICREQLVPGRVVLKDYNYETPDADLLVESQLNTDMPGVHYEYGEHYKDAGDGNRLARVRNEEIECRRRVLEGDSNCVGFRAGFTYTLLNHYRFDFNEVYLLLAIHHHGSQRHAIGLDAMPGEDTAPEVTYHNEYRCLSTQFVFRPERRTPVPRIPGIMIADVEHPDQNADDYGHLDDQGRYRARMNFDLSSTAPADATLPIRMKQPYSGPGYGIHFPNHHKTEMVWACVNGDVNRPMALGTVPNPNQGSPATLGNKWQSVIRTWRRNELTFDDKMSEENIYMHATKDHTVVVVNNESISVGNNQRIRVGNDRTKSVGNDETNTIKNDRTTTIEEGNDSLEVTLGKRDVKVKQDQTFTIEDGDFIVNVQSGSGTMNFHQNRTTNVVTGNDEHNVKGTYALTSEGDLSVESTGGKVAITSPSEIKLTVGGSSITITPSAIEIKAATILSEATSVNKTSGPFVQSEASGINLVQGGLVTINP